ncbi:hypothetical protein J3459_018480 [Metarhizium acridum]|uniref:uncharacterized protein n=1 Tax=Metarhizium acridum TaxID=92637 RepID=UPI001C6C9DB5|nr:hypothetical protein J3459_018480 [Metarhizium acridum]KAG8413029.1 hypothetical protein J3458_013450 [Metarhizium acridum]
MPLLGATSLLCRVVSHHGRVQSHHVDAFSETISTGSTKSVCTQTLAKLATMVPPQCGLGAIAPEVYCALGSFELKDVFLHQILHLNLTSSRLLVCGLAQLRHVYRVWLPNPERALHWPHAMH